VSVTTYAYLLAAGATLCWGFVVIPIKLARIPGRLGIGISMLTGAIAMLLIAGPEMAGFFELPWQEMGRFVLTGCLQFALGCGAYYESIRQGSLSIAVPVTRVKVILTLFFSVFLGLEVFTWSLLGACVLVVLGGILVGIKTKATAARSTGKRHGVSMALAGFACLCWALGETLIGTLPEQFGAVAKNGLMLCSGLVVYSLYLVVSGAWREFKGIPRRDVLCYVVHGLVSFSLAYVLFVKAVGLIGPPRPVLISSTYPLISAMIGWMLFGERYSWRLALGALFLVGGVVLLQFVGS